MATAASIEMLTSAIVVVGDFNPSIYSPDWLEGSQLIGAADADGARQHENLVLTKQVSKVESEWFILDVLQDRFSLTSKGPVAPTLRDLAVGIFSLLPHTPVRAIGLNFMAHYKLSKDDDWHRLGDTLVPKTVWRELYKDEKLNIGMADVTVLVQEGKREEGPTSGALKRLSVQPSAKVKNGVYFALNDHHPIDIKKGDSSMPGEVVVSVINDHWQRTWDEALAVFAGVIERACG